jgi:copper transport protein
VTRAPLRPRRRRAFSLVVGAVAAVLVLLPAGPAAAHASLISTDPEEGAVLEAAPESIRFTFNEPVSVVPDGVHVFDARGDRVEAAATARDAELTVVLDEEVGTGTLVVVWRVVSADGHPVAGSLSFSIGAPSQTVEAPGAETAAASDVPIALSLTRWVGYVGLLLAGGLVWFALLLVPPDAKVDRTRARLSVAARTATAVGVAGWLVGLPLTGAYQRGVGAEGLTDAETWATLPIEEYLVVIAVTVGLVTAAVLVGREPRRLGTRAGGAASGAVAVLGPAATGHPRAVSPELLAVAADALHLLAGGVWLGGLTGLALALPTLSGRPWLAAEVLFRFSAAAAALLGALVLSGAFLAWRIVGSWQGLVSTGYGQLLLVKIAVAATAVLLASWNRFRLLPRVQAASAGHQRAGAAARVLTRTTSLEAGVLVVALFVTGFLVNKSPEEPDTAAIRPASTGVQRAGLGDQRLLATMAPRRPGRNILRIQVQDAAGEPMEGVEAPGVRVSSDQVDLGDVPVTAVAAGTYEAAVVIPRPGTWEVQVSLRTGEFDNPVATVTFQVSD